MQDLHRAFEVDRQPLEDLRSSFRETGSSGKKLAVSCYCLTRRSQLVNRARAYSGELSSNSPDGTRRETGKEKAGVIDSCLM